LLAAKTQKQKQEDCYDFIMMEIQKHLLEIHDLTEKKDSHAVAEIVDLSILTRMLARLQGATPSLTNDRFNKFKEKIR